MRLVALELKNFRCFKQALYRFDHQTALIVGPNGSGKSSLIEALSYACYLKSFRTSSMGELIKHESEGFFIKIITEQAGIERTITIGYTGNDRLIKVDGQEVTSYRDLISQYRVVTVTEDDIAIIKGAPEVRRTFIDQACMLNNPDYAKLHARYRRILKQRNELLASQWHGEFYELLTEQLWKLADEMSAERIRYLEALEKQVRHSFATCGIDKEVQLRYKTNRADHDAQSWMREHQARERALRRSLCGPHLDDIEIVMTDTRSKNGAAGQGAARQYASRGQQKLLALALKLSQFSLLGPSLCLLDDFMTDFDTIHARAVLTLLQSAQEHTIFTVPTADSHLERMLADRPHDMVRLTH